MLSENRWTRLATRLCGSPPPPQQFQRLVAAYSQPQRYYHNTGHITHCLRELDSAADLAEAPDEVEFAIWLHDAVYVPGATGNEERSALWAQDILTQAACPESTALRVRDLILATRHKESPASRDAALIVDIDLSILGQPPPVFEEFERAIREEYRNVPSETYASGRFRILYVFFNRSRVYYTDRFQDRYGIRAKANLARALAALQAGLPVRLRL